MIVRVGFAVLFAFAGCILVLAQDAGNEFQRYRLIEERNIFSPEAPRRVEPSKTAPPEEKPPVMVTKPELVLSGVVYGRETGAYLALVENRLTGELSFAKIGDTILKSKTLTGITIEGITLAEGEKSETFKVGGALSHITTEAAAGEARSVESPRTPDSERLWEEAKKEEASDLSPERKKELMERMKARRKERTKEPKNEGTE